MLEDFRFDVLQSLNDVARSLRDASLQTDLRVDLEAQFLSDLVDLSVWGSFFDMLGTFDYQLTEQEMKDRLSILLINHSKQYKLSHINKKPQQDPSQSYLPLTHYTYPFLKMHQIKILEQQVQMGCCCSNKDEKYSFKSSYDEAWQIFNRSPLSNPDKFKSNKMRMFNFLFLSIVIPYQVHIRAKLDQLIEQWSNDPVEGLKFARKERNAVNQELKELGEDYKKFLQQMIPIKSDILTYEESNFGKDPTVVDIKPTNKMTDKEHAEYLMQKEVMIKAEEEKPHLSFHSRRKQRVNEQSRSRQVTSEIGEAESYQLRGSNLSYTLPASISQLGRSYEQKSLGDSREINQKQIELELMGDTTLHLKKCIKILENQLESVKKDNHFLKQNEMKYQEMEKKKSDIEFTFQQEKEKWHAQLKDCKAELQGIKSKKQELSLLNKTLNERLLSLTNNSSDFKLLDEDGNILNSLDYSRHKSDKFKLISHVIKETIDLSSLQSMVKSQSQNSANHRRSFIIIEKQEISASQGQKKERNYAILFNLFPSSKILPGHTEFQLAVGIRTIISEMFPLHLTKSELLFSYDTLTPIHYNKYISDKENLLILIKLENGIIIGGFAGRFIANNELSESLLFSISHEREPMVLATKKKIKRIDYDSSYLIFGSGQIKIKARTLQFTCNLGSFQSIYSLNNRSVPVDKFLGTSQRNLTMQGYEIHQIFFESFQL